MLRKKRKEDNIIKKSSNKKKSTVKGGDLGNKVRTVAKTIGFEFSDFETNVQDFIGVKNIKNGIIEMDDGRYVKILEIEPINFTLRSAEERNQIIRGFSRVLKTAPMNLQFKSITKRVDSERYINLLKKDMLSEPNEKTRDMIKNYIDLIRNLSGQEALTRRFFIIFEYEKESRLDNNPTMKEVYSKINYHSNTIMEYMSACGNPTVTYSNYEEENRAILEFLYMFFNKRSSIDESWSRRSSKIFKDTMIAKGRDPRNIRNNQEVPIVDLIAPRGIDLSNDNYSIMDGMYYSFLLIPSKGYNSSVLGGWTSLFVNLGDGVDVDIYLNKQDRNKARESVNRNLRHNRVRSFQTAEMAEDADMVSQSVSSGYYLRSSLSNGEDMYYMTTIITITSPMLSQLRDRVKRIETFLTANDIASTQLPYRQERAMKSVMPFAKLDKTLYKLGRRNLTTTGASSTYMFTSFEMSDENGILLGINASNKSLCIVDIFNTKVYANANIAIMGRSGAGKTFLSQLITLRLRMRGTQVFIIAPLKGYEYKHACDYVGGTYVEISTSSPQCINIMEIRKTEASLLELEDMGAADDSLLAVKADQVKIFFSLILRRDLDVEEESILDQAIINTYADFGITRDNNSLVKDDGSGEYKYMPILEDLYNNIIKLGEENPYYTKMTNSLSLSMRRYVGDGSMSSFNQQTNVDLNNKYVVLNISKLSPDMLPVGMFIVLEYCWDKIRENRSRPKAILIDETWKLISENAQSAEFVHEIFKTIRGYAGSAIAATQDLDDFLTLEDGKYGKAIINNSRTKILLGLEKEGARAVADVVGLTSSEYDSIMGFNVGEALFLSNNNRIEIQVIGSEIETRLITTDRSQIEAQLKEKEESALKASK